MNKYDTVLILKSPKLLSSIITHTFSNEYTLEMPNMIENTTSYSVRNGKTNKNNYKEVNFLEEKKAKNRNKKKIKNKIYLDKNILHIKDNLDFQDSTVIQSSKSFKAKRNYKKKYLEENISSTNENTNAQEIYLNDLMTVNELSAKLNVATTDIIKWLFLQGISVTINQRLDISTSTLVAENFSFHVLKEPVQAVKTIDFVKNVEEGILRAPIITLLGHVDHGKTSLLKAIKKDCESIKELGNITQSIGSYEVFVNNNDLVNKLIFLDTPGHEAFTAMRERGADVTDIIVLVVAADDGLKPQTIEAINHIQQRNLPFIVAINKIDKPESNISEVKQQLRKYNIKEENINGVPSIIEISALNNYNINFLLTSLVNISKVYRWKSDPNKTAEGVIIESYLNKKKGTVVQLLIKNGSLHVGDMIIAAGFYGKVKAIQNSLNETVKSVKSTALANVLCFSEVPPVGSSFTVVFNEKEAKRLTSKYADIQRRDLALHSRVSLEDVSKQGSKTVIKQLNIIIKTHSNGVMDAIIYTLSQLPQEKVQINVLMAGCGELSLKDIDLAVTSKSIILLFGLNPNSHILHYASGKGIYVAKFNIIYDLIDYVKSCMLTYIDIEYTKNIIGSGYVKNLFSINNGIVAGCLVQSGKFKKKAYFQIQKNGKSVDIGSISSLKRVKEDVNEVYAGNECGIFCKEYSAWELEDFLECYELQALEKTLS